MSPSLKKTILLVLLTVAHAALTIWALLSYVDYAIRVDHGIITPSLMGTVCQYLRSILFLPILLPALRWHADLVSGAQGYLVALLNSALWAAALGWLWRRKSST